jgi:hypothetical protein
MSKTADEKRQALRSAAIQNYNNDVLKAKQQTLSYLNYLNAYRRRYHPTIYRNLYNHYVNSYYSYVAKRKTQLLNKLKQIDAMQFPEEKVEPVANTVEPKPENSGSVKSALLIGINYNGTEYKLDGCINDLEAFNDLCSKQHNYTEIKQLRDDKSNSMPTRKNILAELEKKLQNAKKGDTILFFYSGHGAYKEDTDGDEVTGYDQVLVPCDFDLIVDDELKALLTKYIVEGITFIGFFDCCYSGTMLDLKYQWSNILFDNKDTKNTKLSETKGDVIMISGCNDTQTSSDAHINGKFSGAMRWALMKSLQDKPEITWADLLKNMRSLLKNAGFTQVPQLSTGRKFDINKRAF